MLWSFGDFFSLSELRWLLLVIRVLVRSLLVIGFLQRLFLLFLVLVRYPIINAVSLQLTTPQAGTACRTSPICVLIFLSTWTSVFWLPRRSVFFHLFAAAKPSANVCVAHGTLCNDPSVYAATTALKGVCEFRPRQFRSVSANFGLFRRNLWQPLAELEFLQNPGRKTLA